MYHKVNNEIYNTNQQICTSHKQTCTPFKRISSAGLCKKEEKKINKKCKIFVTVSFIVITVITIIIKNRTK